MEEFIHQVSVGVEVIHQLVNNRQYDITKDNLIVPPHLWEDMVLPGSTVVMRSRDSVVDKNTSWLRKSFKKSSFQ
jgi:hypothetical protein